MLIIDDIWRARNDRLFKSKVNLDIQRMVNKINSRFLCHAKVIDDILENLIIFNPSLLSCMLIISFLPILFYLMEGFIKVFPLALL